MVHLKYAHLSSSATWSWYSGALLHQQLTQMNPVCEFMLIISNTSTKQISNLFTEFYKLPQPSNLLWKQEVNASKLWFEQNNLRVSEIITVYLCNRTISVHYNQAGKKFSFCAQNILNDECCRGGRLCPFYLYFVEGNNLTLSTLKFSEKFLLNYSQHSALKEIIRYKWLAHRMYIFENIVV